MRRPIAEQIKEREEQSIEDFMDAWFSEAAQLILRRMEIRE
jgi:hypothetical protein